VLAIKVTIERFTQEWQPGWVECTFADAAGRSHVFDERFRSLPSRTWTPPASIRERGSLAAKSLRLV
jgi:hypothetical protein